jgi:hypothetical protein
VSRGLRRTRRPGAAALGAVIVSLSSPAWGDEEAVAEARAAYEAGAAAYDRGDHAAAAARLAEADARVPNARALQLAMAAALLGDDARLALELADRADARAVDGPLAELALRIRRRFAGEVARAPREAEAPARTPEAPTDKDVPGGETRGGRERQGLPPVLFWTALGVTAVGVGTSTALTLATKRRHDDFVREPSAEAARAGEAAQTRARVAWGVTGALAVATAIVAWRTDFGSDDGARSISLRVGPLGAFASGHFR